MPGKARVPYFVPLVFNESLVARTDKRRCTIIPPYVGKTIEVYNGKSYIPLKITPEMVNFKLGDFILTKPLKLNAQKEKLQRGQKKKK